MENTIRLFTCMAQEDIPSDKHLKAALGAFQAYQVGPISGETGIPGLKIDFKRGLRIRIPKGNWHVRITDFDTETLFFDDDVSDLQLVSMEKYYIHWSIEIWEDGTPVFSHIFDPEGQEIFFLFAHTALGDNLAMLPYVRAFREKYHCVFHALRSNPIRVKIPFMVEPIIFITGVYTELEIMTHVVTLLWSKIDCKRLEREQISETEMVVVFPSRVKTNLRMEIEITVTKFILTIEQCAGACYTRIFTGIVNTKTVP